MTKYAGFAGFLKQNAATGTPTGTYNTVAQLMTLSAVGATAVRSTCRLTVTHGRTSCRDGSRVFRSRSRCCGIRR